MKADKGSRKLVYILAIAIASLIFWQTQIGRQAPETSFVPARSNPAAAQKSMEKAIEQEAKECQIVATLNQDYGQLKKGDRVAIASRQWSGGQAEEMIEIVPEISGAFQGNKQNVPFRALTLEFIQADQSPPDTDLSERKKEDSAHLENAGEETPLLLAANGQQSFVLGPNEQTKLLKIPVGAICQIASIQKLPYEVLVSGPEGRIISGMTGDIPQLEGRRIRIKNKGGNLSQVVVSTSAKKIE